MGTGQRRLYAIDPIWGGTEEECNLGYFFPKQYQGIQILTGLHRNPLDLMLTMYHLSKRVLTDEFCKKVEKFLVHKEISEIFRPEIIKGGDFSFIERDPIIPVDGGYNLVPKEKLKPDTHHTNPVHRGGALENEINLLRKTPYTFHHKGIHYAFDNLLFPEILDKILNKFFPNAFIPEFREAFTKELRDAKIEEVFRKESFENGNFGKKDLFQVPSKSTKMDLSFLRPLLRTICRSVIK